MLRQEKSCYRAPTFSGTPCLHTRISNSPVRKGLETYGKTWVIMFSCFPCNSVVSLLFLHVQMLQQIAKFVNDKGGIIV